MGFVKALWYRFRQYPTFIVNRREKYTGWDEKTLAEILERHLAEKTAA
ncbi:MAG: hypothetical protein KJ621_15220 [Proteobacteria bacterium]|nr:hypothetical protein [Pseudomonadota bacterium]MBU1740678.1 hypothetical protein [Pseudomonadota bacterium]